MSSAKASALAAVLITELVLGLVGTAMAFNAADGAQQAARATAATSSSNVAGPAVGQWQAPRIPLIELPMTPNVSVLVLAASAGFVGTLVHVLTVFTARRGYGTLGARFAAWYVATPVTGAALAVLLVAAIHVGLISAVANADAATNLFGVIALAGVTGLFARRATDRLALLLGDSSAAAARGGTPPPVFAGQRTTGGQVPVGNVDRAPGGPTNGTGSMGGSR